MGAQLLVLMGPLQLRWILRDVYQSDELFMVSPSCGLTK